MTQNAATLFLSAGEASGDHYGAQILTRLKSLLPEFHAFGLGGAEMETAGFECIVRAEDVAVMGITEVLRHMPRIYGEYRRLVDSIQRKRPDVAVLIDFPDVNLRLAEKLHAQGVPVIYFVSPQLWAWKRNRIEQVRRYVTKMLVIFPFEQEFYRNRGIDAEFVGHPLAEMPLPTEDRGAYARSHELHASRSWIALLPGSRMREVRHNLPVMLETAKLLGNGYEFLVPVASTLAPKQVMKKIREIQPDTAANIHMVDDARAALFHAQAAVVASGTATVQAAVIGKPFVVVYRVSPTTYFMAKNMVRYPAEIPAQRDASGNLPVAMVNLIAAGLEPGLRVVPELLQQEFTAANVAARLRPLLSEGPERNRMQQQLQRIRTALLPRAAAGNTAAGQPIGSIDSVCRTVVRLMQRQMPDVTLTSDDASNMAASTTTARASG